jgi:hypothetical protein
LLLIFKVSTRNAIECDTFCNIYLNWRTGYLHFCEYELTPVYTPMGEHIHLYIKKNEGTTSESKTSRSNFYPKNQLQPQGPISLKESKFAPVGQVHKIKFGQPFPAWTANTSNICTKSVFFNKHGAFIRLCRQR